MALASGSASSSSTNLPDLASEGEVLAGMRVDSSIGDHAALTKRIHALKIPPLPPDLGALTQPDGRPFSIHHLQPVFNEGPEAWQQKSWRPKESCLVATLSEHTKAVNRLAVSQDCTFFVSASDDGTSKIWELRGIDQNICPKSALTYTRQQGGRILDVTMCDNSHSVASASSDGTVHVWRVEVVAKTVESNRGGGMGGRRTGRNEVLV